MKEWTYAELLTDEQAKICNALGWVFDRYGLEDHKGVRLVEKFWDQDEFEDFITDKFLVNELEQHCKDVFGIFINYSRIDMEFKPESIKFPDNSVGEFNQEKAMEFISKDYIEMMKNSLLYVLNKRPDFKIMNK